MTEHTGRTDRAGRATIGEIAALTGRLRALHEAGRGGDRDEVARFLTEEHELIERISAAGVHADPPPARRGSSNARTVLAADHALQDIARARAQAGGYVLLGPSARTWHADPAGRPVAAASEPEHRAVRALMGRHELDTTEPSWIGRGDGRSEIAAAVIVTARADTGSTAPNPVPRHHSHPDVDGDDGGDVDGDVDHVAGLAAADARPVDPVERARRAIAELPERQAGTGDADMAVLRAGGAREAGEDDHDRDHDCDHDDADADGWDWSR